MNEVRNGRKIMEQKNVVNKDHPLLKQENPTDKERNSMPVAPNNEIERNKDHKKWK